MTVRCHSYPYAHVLGVAWMSSNQTTAISTFCIKWIRHSHMLLTRDAWENQYRRCGICFVFSGWKLEFGGSHWWWRRRLLPWPTQCRDFYFGSTNNLSMPQTSRPVTYEFIHPDEKVIHSTERIRNVNHSLPSGPVLFQHTRIAIDHPSSLSLLLEEIWDICATPIFSQSWFWDILSISQWQEYVWTAPSNKDSSLRTMHIIIHYKIDSPGSMQASVGTHFMAFIPTYILPTVCGKKFSRRTSKLFASSMNKQRPSLFRSNIKLAPGKKFSGNKIYSQDAMKYRDHILVSVFEPLKTA